jgi:hypothetical protein
MIAELFCFPAEYKGGGGVQKFVQNLGAISKFKAPERWREASLRQVKVKMKVMSTLEQAMKARSGSRGTILLFL